VPEAQVVCAAVTGTTDIPRFPRRPRVRVEFFAPEQGPRLADETANDLGARLLAELRARAPISAAGRRRRSAPAARA
jgi:1-acyl-sn-glycerol-3-phosphate acyltransferase